MIDLLSITAADGKRVLVRSSHVSAISADGSDVEIFLLGGQKISWPTATPADALRVLEWWRAALAKMTERGA